MQVYLCNDKHIFFLTFIQLIIFLYITDYGLECTRGRMEGEWTYSQENFPVYQVICWASCAVSSSRENVKFRSTGNPFTPFTLVLAVSLYRFRKWGWKENIPTFEGLHLFMDCIQGKARGQAGLTTHGMANCHPAFELDLPWHYINQYEWVKRELDNKR